MILRRRTAMEFALRRPLVRVFSGILFALMLAAPAQATLLPQGFFDMQPAPAAGPAAVEADQMAYDGPHKTVSALGRVLMSYQGFTLRADKVEYDQATGAVHASGHVTLRDPDDDIYQSDSLEVTGGMKEAFLKSLTLTTKQGARVTASDVHYMGTLQTILTDASYAPCGLCMDAKGRPIGWKVKAARIIYDRDHASVSLEQPSLELLGIPVAWIPWFWVPDPTQPRATGLRMPSVDFDRPRGAVAAVPFFVPVGENIDVLLTPQLMSRQGGLMGGKVDWRLPGFGAIEVKASGLYQLDKSAFAGTVGYRDWRGAIQTSAEFTPADHWTAGWSYSAFTDNAYLVDYKFTDATSSTNRLYGTYLDEMTWFDARIEQGNLLGNYANNDPAQGITLPQISFDHVQEMQPGWGDAHVSGELLSVVRGADQVTATAVPTVNPITGYKELKQHLELEGAWENQYILPGGVTASPYVGARLDAAGLEDSSLPDATLFSLTPIAAMDFRWPLMAKSGFDTHLLEPVAQLVYRGSATTDVGITNDDAQSFVFDTSNLFSYNHFSGIDRQDTGLRANLGGHYLANFADGSWLELIAGESFQLAGPNGLGVSDAALTGTNTGLGSTASYIVASARGGFSNGLTGAGKVQIDPAGKRVTRAGAGVNYAPGNGFSAGGSYLFVAADPAIGTTQDLHEVTGALTVPLPIDYWSVNGDVTYDLATGGWLNTDAGVTYDDGYLELGGVGNVTPTSWGVGVRFKLKGPDHKDAF